jgi:predicted GTPase
VTAAEPAATRAPVRRKLTTDVLRFANTVHGFLEQHERADLAGRVSAEAARWNEADVSVIIAGDIKRGKSRLVNALVAHPGLLPVDADVATSIHLVVRYGDALSISVTRLHEGDVRTDEIPPDQLIDYASMAGDESLREGVMSVEVRVNSPLLAGGLALIDTPGVGGMSRGHRDITMAALQRADALLFTISSEEPISRTELEFLAEASERIDTVVLVVTKADLNTDDRNEAMLAENREKIVAHQRALQHRADEGDERARELADRFERLVTAPFVLTSAYMAEQAVKRAERGRAEQAASYRERSGLDLLEGPLVRTVVTREDVRLANILQLARILVADVTSATEARLRALDGDRTVETELETQQAQLEEFASKQARWRSNLANAIQRLQTEAGRKVSRELNLVRNHYRELLEQPNLVDTIVDTLPEELERSLHASWNNLAEQARHDFDRVVVELLKEFGVEGMETVLGDLEMPSGLAEMIDRSQADTEHQFTLLDDALPLTMQTFTFGNIANAAGGALGIATGGLGLIAYGVGAAIAVPILRMRKQKAKQRQTVVEYQRILNEALFGQEGIAKEFTTELTLRIIDVRERVELLVEQRLAERRKELEQRRRELQSLLQTEMKQRARTKQVNEQMLGELAKLGGDAERLQDLVRASLEHPSEPGIAGEPVGAGTSEDGAASDGSTTT